MSYLTPLIEDNSLVNFVVSRKKERTTIMLTLCGNPIKKTIDFVGLQFNTSLTGGQVMYRLGWVGGGECLGGSLFCCPPTQTLYGLVTWGRNA